MSLKQTGCRLAVLTVFMAALGWAVSAGAAESVPGAPGQGMSPAEIMAKGGSLMWVLAVMSVAAVAFIIYLFAVIRPAEVAPPELQRSLIEKLRAGGVDEARRSCEEKPTPLSAVVLAALDYVRSVPDVDPALVKDVMEGEGSRQAEDIQGQTQYLLDIAVIAPMIGLLGTVFGMLRAFSGIAHDVASARPVVLADGVAMALLTTAFGLIVGIPSMMFYAYFRRRAAKAISSLEIAATEILTSMLSRGEGRVRLTEIKDQLRKG
jgi:biopolymer transport protein ExbB